MNRKITRALAVTVFALGLGGGAAATFVGAGHPSHNATSVRSDSGQYFVCFAVLNTYGACIGPPTNY